MRPIAASPLLLLAERLAENQPRLKGCKLKGYRPPSSDSYGWARLCQVLGNFFGGSNSVGISTYTTDRQMDPGDNGIYVIDGWEIIERLTTDYSSYFSTSRMVAYPESQERSEYDFAEMHKAFDESMPEAERLGAFLDAEVIPVSELRLGNKVWMRKVNGSVKAYPVVGFSTEMVNDSDRTGEECDDIEFSNYNDNENLALHVEPSVAIEIVFS